MTLYFWRSDSRRTALKAAFAASQAALKNAKIEATGEIQEINVLGN